jgi:hypothetical protein
MPATETQSASTGSLLASILSEDSFRPAEPKSIEETGLTSALIENLILKHVLLLGSAAGRQIADNVCLPFGLLDPIFQSLRQRQLILNSSSAQLGDFVYTLTDQGRQRARSVMEQCSYLGAAPVPLDDYIVSVDAQTIRAESPQKRHLVKAFSDVSVEAEMLEMLGPAVNSGAGMFLYGAPGNGKTTLAKRITMCFGSSIWIPKTITEDGQFIKLFDAACHEPITDSSTGLLKSAEHDRRWIKIRRPTVVVGGELTMDALDIRHDTNSNVSEASLQLKSNCGCLDYAAGKPHRLPDAGHRKEDPGAVRPAHHLQHQPAANGPGGRGVLAPHPIQDRGRRSVAGGIQDAVQADRQEPALRIPRGSGGLPGREALPACRPAAPPLPASRPDVSDPQLLRL